MKSLNSTSENQPPHIIKWQNDESRTSLSAYTGHSAENNPGPWKEYILVVVHIYGTDGVEKLSVQLPAITVVWAPHLLSIAFLLIQYKQTILSLIPTFFWSLLRTPLSWSEYKKLKSLSVCCFCFRMRYIFDHGNRSLHYCSATLNLPGALVSYDSRKGPEPPLIQNGCHPWSVVYTEIIMIFCLAHWREHLAEPLGGPH